MSDANLPQFLIKIVEKLTNFEEFLAMSGYGLYVWACYVIGLLVIIAMVLIYQRSLRRALAEQSTLESGKK